jgi:membrane protein
MRAVLSRLQPRPATGREHRSDTMKSLWRGLRALMRECSEHRIGDEGAKVAFYFFLSLFPLILSLFALTGLVGGDKAFEWVMNQLSRSTPADTREWLGQFVREITNQQRPGVLSIGIVLTAWSASTVFVALGASLNVMYGVRETRSFIHLRVLALLLLVFGGVLSLAGSALVIAGPEIAHALHLGVVAPVFGWPTAFVLLVLFIALILFVLPNRAQGRSIPQVLLGALVGALVWIVATALFRVYVTRFSSFDRTYGVVGGVLVLLLWLQVTAVAILLGGEIASLLEARNQPSSERTTPRVGAPAHA